MSRRISVTALTAKVERLEKELKALEPMIIHVGEVRQLKRKLVVAERRISKLVTEKQKRKGK